MFCFSLEVETSVEISVTMNGQIIEQTVVPEIVPAELTAALPAPSSGLSYNVTTTKVNASATVDIKAAFSQTFTSRVLTSHTEQIVSLIQEEYIKGNHSRASLNPFLSSV